MNSQIEIMDLVERYCSERHRFKKDKDILDDVNIWVEKKSKGNSYMSKKFIRKVDGAILSEHYKLSKTHIVAKVLCRKRREPRVLLLKCNYIMSSKGNVYFVEKLHDQRLFIFSGHFFDRLSERWIERDGIMEDPNRHDSITFGVYEIQMSEFRMEIDPLLVEPDTDQVFYMMRDGYAAGEYITMQRPELGREPVTICFFKTFLSREEVSPAKMDRLLEIYRTNKENTQGEEYGIEDHITT